MSGHGGCERDAGRTFSRHDDETAPIRVLYVEDDATFAETVALYLEREDEAFEVTTVPDADDALDRLGRTAFDCVVSDYEMPGLSGLEFLDVVRRDAPDLPFVLYTGKGSEEVASEAISAGVDEYLQKSVGTGQYTLLATRIRTLVRSHRMERELRANERRYRTLVEMSPDPIVVHVDGALAYVNDAFVELVAAEDPSELQGASFASFFDPAKGRDLDEAVQRIQAGDLSPTCVEQQLGTRDGRKRFVETTSRAITYEDRPAVLTIVSDVTDRRRFEETLTRLHDWTREMMRATDPETTAQFAVKTVMDVLPFERAAFYAFDDGTDELVPSAWRGPAGDGTDDPPVVPSGSFLWDVFVGGEATYAAASGDATDGVAAVLGDDGEPVRASTSADGVAVADGNEHAAIDQGMFAIPVSTDGLLIADGAPETPLPVGAWDLAQLLGKNVEAALDRTEQHRAIRDRDRRLQEQNEELGQLNRINEVVRDVNRVVVGATSRADVERTVCERLAETDAYEFAWIAAPDAGTALDARAWAGVDPEYVDHASEALAPLRALVGDAVERESIQVSHDLLEDPTWDAHRRDLLTYGYRSIAAVPIRRHAHADGALVIHATDATAFTARECEVLSELGEMIGYAIRNATGSSALPADERIELELSVPDRSFFLNQLAAATDGDVTCEGVVPTARGQTSAILRVADVDPDRFERRVADLELVDRFRELTVDASGGLFQVTLTDPPLVELLGDCEATLRSLSTGEDGSTAVVELPVDADVRSVVEVVRSRYPRTTLRARHDLVAPARTSWQFREDLQSDLTDRQLEVLRTAFCGDYYESPRGTTGNDLAEALAISPPTFHHHLRNAEKTVVTAVLGPHEPPEHWGGMPARPEGTVYRAESAISEVSPSD